MNAGKLRALLTHVEDYPKLFDTTVYGLKLPSGDVTADLAGRTLLLSGWTLPEDNTFRSPDGLREVSGPWDIEAEAQKLLGLSDDDLWNHGDLDNLFDLPARYAVNRLREVTEEAEAEAEAVKAGA